MAQRIATYANEAGRTYTAPLMTDDAPPRTHTTRDGVVLELRAVHTITERDAGYARLLEDLATPTTPKPLHEEVATILQVIRDKDAQQARQRAWGARLFGGMAA